DGDCGFCTSSARFIERHVPVRAAFVPYQHADLDALGVTAERARHEVLWIDRAGRVGGGAGAGGRLLTWAGGPWRAARRALRGGPEAVGRLLTCAGGPWRALGTVIRVAPVSWAAWAVYRLVAINRHRMPGGTAACALPADRRPGARG